MIYFILNAVPNISQISCALRVVFFPLIRKGTHRRLSYISVYNVDAQYNSSNFCNAFALFSMYIVRSYFQECFKIVKDRSISMEMDRSKWTNLDEISKAVSLSLENLKLKIERNHTNTFTCALRPMIIK